MFEKAEAFIVSMSKVNALPQRLNAFKLLATFHTMLDDCEE